jgi:hypothetical protein
MQFEMYLNLLFGTCLGLALHILMKVKGLQRRYPKEEHLFKLFWKKDWLFVLISLLGIIIIIFVITEYINIKVWKDHTLKNFLRTFSVLGGIGASSLMYFAFGATEKILRIRAKADGIDMPDNDLERTRTE